MYDDLSRYYDLAHAGLTEDIPFVLGLAAEASGPILEIGCGSGRLLLPLARAGHYVTGVDSSPAMLAIAAQRLAQEDDAVRERVRLLEADATAPLPSAAGTMALALVGFNTFMHFSELEAAATLRNAARLLRPGGVLCIDVDNPFELALVQDEAALALEEEWADPATGQVVQQWATYAPAEDGQAVDVTWVFRELGAPAPAEITVQMRYHYYYPHQVDLLLQQSGLRLVALYGDYDRRPFGEESDRLLLLALAA